jgi:hypothetical protein
LKTSIRYTIGNKLLNALRIMRHEAVRFMTRSCMTRTGGVDPRSYIFIVP